MNIQFYHLTTTPLERALPKLLEKAYAAGLQTLVVAEPEERVERLNELLWTYDPGSFLPHGSTKDGHNNRQPILLAASLDKESPAKLLVVTNGQSVEATGRFEKILDVFDGKDEQVVEKARIRWSFYKNNGHEMTYFRQTEQGSWEQKAIA